LERKPEGGKESIVLKKKNSPENFAKKPSGQSRNEKEPRNNGEFQPGGSDHALWVQSRHEEE